MTSYGSYHLKQLLTLFQRFGQLSCIMCMVQVGFFEIVALPLFKQYVECMPMAQPVLDAVKANYQYWHRVHHMHDGCGKSPHACDCSAHR